MGRLLTIALGVCAGLALAGCQSVAPEAGPDRQLTGLNIPAGSNEDFIVNVGRRIFFTENSADLTDVSRATLDKQAEWLTLYPAYKIKIEGFSDEKGTPDFNKQLGMKRAQAAMSYFALKGVPAGRMRIKTFGNERPVRKCDDLSCWSQNRRVVTVLDTEVGS